MSRLDIVKSKFPTFSGDVNIDFNHDENGNCEELLFIGVSENIVTYSYPYLGECMCCYYKDTDSDTLENALDRMSDSEFEILLTQLVEYK